MKIALGMRIQSGPHGGGNRFGAALIEHWTARGGSVYTDLNCKDLDAIILTDPRRVPVSTFTHVDVAKYLKDINPHAIVLHRVNECDERKGTCGLNRYLMRANRIADATVFISAWLRDLFVTQGYSPAAPSVIFNGADARIFCARDQPCMWNSKEPMRLVTHHWGGNRMKGFDIYEHMDKLLDSPAWRTKISFTYIGNLPAGVKLPNTRLLRPLDGEKLAQELAQHHVYVSGSLHEPAGMHHIEGALCGLPLIYRNSGALPEYCAEYGLGFSGADEVADAIHRMMSEYESRKMRMKGYPHTAEKMCQNYCSFIESLVNDRKAIISARKNLRPKFYSCEPRAFQIYWGVLSRVLSMYH